MNINGYKIGAVEQVYFLLSRAFSFPDESLRLMVNGEMQILQDSAAGLPFKIKAGNIPIPSHPSEELESYYIATFDTRQGGGTGCSLYEGMLRKDEGREGIMMELLRFYEHFDIKLNKKERDYPDHLVTELEFMAFLSQKEKDALERGKDANPYRNAQRDFLERHLNKLVQPLNEKIQQNLNEPFYKEMSLFLAAFVANHLSHLKANKEIHSL